MQIVYWYARDAEKNAFSSLKKENAPIDEMKKMCSGQRLTVLCSSLRTKRQ